MTHNEKRISRIVLGLMVAGQKLNEGIVRRGLQLAKDCDAIYPNEVRIINEILDSYEHVVHYTAKLKEFQVEYEKEHETNGRRD